MLRCRATARQDARGAASAPARGALGHGLPWQRRTHHVRCSSASCGLRRCRGRQPWPARDMNSDRNTTLEPRCYGSKQAHAFFRAKPARGGTVTRSANWALLGGLASLFLIVLLCTEPASACSWVSAKAAMAAMEDATAVSANYWIASILLGGALIGLEFRQRRFWLFPAITLANTVTEVVQRH